MRDTLGRFMTGHGTVNKECCIRNCINKSRKLNMCTKHYQRLKRHGDLELHYRYGEDHQSWIGENVSYHGIHAWVKKRKQNHNKCEKCKK